MARIGLIGAQCGSAICIERLLKARRWAGRGACATPGHERQDLRAGGPRRRGSEVALNGWGGRRRCRRPPLRNAPLRIARKHLKIVRFQHNAAAQAPEPDIQAIAGTAPGPAPGLADNL